MQLLPSLTISTTTPAALRAAVCPTIPYKYDAFLTESSRPTSYPSLQKMYCTMGHIPKKPFQMLQLLIGLQRHSHLRHWSWVKGVIKPKTPDVTVCTNPLNPDGKIHFSI